MINFTGQYITKANIQRYNGTNYSNFRANIVELSPYCKDDLNTLKNTSYYWQNGNNKESLINKIYRTALIFNKKEYLEENCPKFYAITIQQDKFKKLNPEDILGVSQISEISQDLTEIDFFQVAPECEYGTFEREYRNTGYEMMNFIKKHYKNSIIILSALVSAIPFYKKMGFESMSPDKSRWILKH